MNELIYLNDESERLDKFLSESVENLSRSMIQKMIDKELVKVNNKLEKASFKLRKNDVIHFIPMEKEEMSLEPENLDLKIVYEDQNLAIIDKPKGMVVHPACGNYSHTLVNGLLYSLDNLSGVGDKIRPGIVHRIDKDTTGLLLVAKNDDAHKYLSKSIEKKEIKRAYLALVEGNIIEDKGIINAPIGRDPQNRKKYAVKEGGKEAITTFTVLERFETKTLVECILKTGRTHQIRVHFAYINHPIYGDPLYARHSEGTKNGQYLHAYLLGFNDMKNGEYKEYTSELPAYFKDKLEQLRRKSK